MRPPWFPRRHRHHDGSSFGLPSVATHPCRSPSPLESRDPMLEVRAERIELRAARNLRRSSKVDRRHAGSALREVEEAIHVRSGGPAREHVGGSASIEARSIHRTVRGPASVRHRRDNTIVGGALAEVRAGCELSMSAMSDEIVVGAGLAVSTPLTIASGGLLAHQDRPVSAMADGVLVEIARLAIEREYAASQHRAAAAIFSGTVYSTQATGLLPLLRCYCGVRNLSSGSSSPSGPSPSPAPEPPSSPLLADAPSKTPQAAPPAPSARAPNPSTDVFASTPGRASGLDDAHKLGKADSSSLHLDPNETILAGNAPLPSPSSSVGAQSPSRGSRFFLSDLVSDGLPSFPESGLQGTQSEPSTTGSFALKSRAVSGSPSQPQDPEAADLDPFRTGPAATPELLGFPPPAGARTIAPRQPRAARRPFALEASRSACLHGARTSTSARVDNPGAPLVSRRSRDGSALAEFRSTLGDRSPRTRRLLQGAAPRCGRAARALGLASRALSGSPCS